MKPNESNPSARAPRSGLTTGSAASAVALAKAIRGDTLIGTPGQPRPPAATPDSASPAPAAPATRTPPTLRTTPPPPVRTTEPTIAPFPVLLTTPANPSVTTPPHPAAITPPAGVTAPVYKAQNPGSSAAIIRTMTLVLKFGIAAAIVLGICYFTVNTAVPVLKELSAPKDQAATAPDKDANVFVQAIQQTRQVVAKNDANVSRLDALIADPDGTGVALAGNAAPLANGQPAPAFDPNQQPIPDSAFAGAPAEPVAVSIYSASGPIEVASVKSTRSRLSPELFSLLETRVTDLPINGIRNGATPRIIMDGVLVKVGDMVDYEHELRFVGIDRSQRLLRFETSDGDIFTRSY